MEEARTMTVKEVIEHNNEILRSISLTPDQREEYGKLCSVIDNNLICIQAMEQSEAKSDLEPMEEVEADAVPET